MVISSQGARAGIFTCILASSLWSYLRPGEYSLSLWVLSGIATLVQGLNSLSTAVVPNFFARKARWVHPMVHPWGESRLWSQSGTQDNGEVWGKGEREGAWSNPNPASWGVWGEIWGWEGGFNLALWSRGGGLPGRGIDWLRPSVGLEVREFGSRGG